MSECFKALETGQHISDCKVTCVLVLGWAKNTVLLKTGHNANET